MLAWEYRVEDVSDSRSGLTPDESPEQRELSLSVTIDWRLNQLGREGWELVGATFVAAEEPFWKLILKRPRAAPWPRCR